MYAGLSVQNDFVPIFTSRPPSMPGPMSRPPPSLPGAPLNSQPSYQPFFNGLSLPTFTPDPPDSMPSNKDPHTAQVQSVWMGLGCLGG